MKSMKRILKSVFSRGDTVKAVVIGAKGSGKTSLLVSLYSNLRAGSTEKFNPSKTWKVDPFESCEDELPPNIPHFDFDGARREMKKGDFPDSTTDWSVMKLRGWLINGSKNKKKRVTLEILDLPGERVADFTMVDPRTKAQRPFRIWSDVIKNAYDDPDEFEEYLKSIRKVDLEKDVDAKKEILTHYRNFVSKLYEKKSLFFTPSTIRLDAEGRLLIPGAGQPYDEVIKTLDANPFFREKHGQKLDEFKHKIEELRKPTEGKSEESDLESRVRRVFDEYKRDIPVDFKGLQDRNLIVRVDFRKMLEDSPLGLKDAEFAPLPEEAFGKNKKEWANIVKQFSKAYSQYYKKIVKPLIDWCKDVDQLYYLVDVLGILSRGQDAYDYESGFGRRVLEVFKKTYSNAVWGGITDRIPKWSVSSLAKACLIVTQADKVFMKVKDNDENRTKLKEDLVKLVKDLHYSNIRMTIGVEAKDTPPVVCAAISSNYGQTEIPAEWPIPAAWPSTQEEWNGKKYAFKRTKNCPKCDIRSASVENLWLDSVATEMLNV